MANKIWHVGLYARLSKEDGRAQSLSIEHQLLRMRVFLAGQGDLEEAGVYVDDGASGMRMDRPGFLQLLQDVEEGKIDCVMVKDPSRLSRNYLEAGRLLEEWFVERRVRVISLELPFFDTCHEKVGVLLPLQNVLNDDFCRQTSAKIRAVLKAKKEQGQFLGAFAPYGYRKGPDHTLEVDEAAAEIVREIFWRYVEAGESRRQIAEALNARQIPCPSAYKRQQGLPFYSPAASQKEGRWTEESISGILHHPVYRGDLAQGRFRRKSYKIPAQMRVNREDWIVAPGAVTALLSAAQFDLAQCRRQKSRQTGVRPFGGKLFCGQCRGPMTSKSSRGRYYYVCACRKKGGACPGVCVAEEWLLAQVMQVIGPPPAMEKVPVRQEDTTFLENLYLEKLAGKISEEMYERCKNKLLCQRQETFAVYRRETSAVEQQRRWVRFCVEKAIVGAEEVQLFFFFFQPAVQ